jgi:hypothetical protein
MSARGARGAALLLGFAGPGILGLGILVLGILGCGHKSEPKSAAAQHGSPSGPSSIGAANSSDLAQDDRIAWLLAPCARMDPFLADTTDMTSVLVGKLARGQLDPLRQAKTELVQMGEAALPELKRFCERCLGDPDGAMPLLNAYAVLGAMESRAGHDLLVIGLSRPQDTVRLEAIRGLSRCAGREDYDRLMALVPLSSPDVLRSIGAALVTADPERYEDDYVAWLSSLRAEPTLWTGAPERVSTARRPAILARFREIYPTADGEVRAYLAAALAASGDETALAALHADLKHENPARRGLAIHALAAVGLARECAGVLTDERDETLRELAARAIAELPATEETAGWLRKGLRDRALGVRQACLGTLARRGDTEARDLGIGLLQGDRTELEYAITVLRDSWAADPSYAARALDVFVRLRTGELAPLRVDRLTLDRAIAQVPLAPAAELLYASARSAHRWYLMQAGNTGAPGRAWLRERWSEESDPLRRIDIAMAGSYDKDDKSREFLLKIAEDERSDPLEVLYAANLLVHQGPAAIVAPRLKRIALRVSDARARPAFNCLLWQWYGDS